MLGKSACGAEFDFGGRDRNFRFAADQTVAFPRWMQAPICTIRLRPFTLTGSNFNPISFSQSLR